MSEIEAKCSDCAAGTGRGVKNAGKRKSEGICGLGMTNKA